MIAFGYFRSFLKRISANYINLNKQLSIQDNHENTYPMSPYPYGWYAVCLSDELSQTRPKPLSFFGKEFVALRDNNNKPHIFDAYCPHMGAHLGYRGIAYDGKLSCPLHGWTFDSNGLCVNAPFAKKTPCYTASRLKSYETIELLGVIFIWFHVDNTKPLFMLPGFDESDKKSWTKSKSFSMSFRSHVQEIRENFCDETHFHFVHRQQKPAFINFEATGPVATVRSSLEGLTELTLKNYPSVETEATMYGPGIMAVRTNGFVTATSIALTTPINQNFVQFRLLTFGKKSNYFPGLGNIFRFLQDFYAFNDLLLEGSVWNHKIYKQRPLLQQNERTIPKFRAWYKQFYETKIDE